MHDYIRQARERWARRMPGATHVQHYDAVTHFQTHYIDTMLTLADMAMEDEGIPEHVRQRVIRTVVYGSPNPADAELRITQHEQDVARLLEQNLPLDPNLFTPPAGEG